MNKKLIRFDWAMKKLLRHKANFGILEGLLSELLRFDVHIENILESEANKEDEYDKYNRVDILVKSQNGELMLVEVQNDSEVDYFQRMLFGVSKLVTEYIQQGEPYGKIKKIYSVNIVYFGLGQGKDYVYEYRGEFVGLHENDILQPTILQKRDYRIEKIADIFPKYYLLKVNNFNKIAEDTLDEWVYFLKTSEVGEGFKAKGLDKAKEKMRYEQLSDSEKKSYDRFQENRLIERSVEYTREEEAKLRELEANSRVEEAKKREEEANSRVEEAKKREEEASLREEEAKLRELEAKKREEEASSQVEEAKKREEQASLRAEEAKKREEDLVRQINQREEEAALVGIKAGKLAIARTAILTGLPNELIAQITGLAMAEIQQLRTE